MSKETPIKNTITIATVPVPVNTVTEGTAFIPPKNTTYYDNGNILKMLAFAIIEKIPVLLIGDSGTGKTSALRYLASQTNNSFRRVNLNGGSTVDELVGKNLVSKDGVYWVDGILIDAMRNGHWIVIDEINAAGIGSELLFVLHSLLDDDGYIVLTDKADSEIVRPHKNFRLFATCNPHDGNYAGTKELNKALLSRFGMVIRTDFLSKANEKRIIKKRVKDIPDAVMTSMVEYANHVREAFKKGESEFVFTTRELVAWAQLYQFLGGNVKESARLAFLGKASDEDAKSMASLLLISFENDRVQDVEKEIQLNHMLLIAEDIFSDGSTGQDKLFLGKGTKARLISSDTDDKTMQLKLISTKPLSDDAEAEILSKGYFIPDSRSRKTTVSVLSNALNGKCVKVSNRN